MAHFLKAPESIIHDCSEHRKNPLLSFVSIRNVSHLMVALIHNVINKRYHVYIKTSFCGITEMWLKDKVTKHTLRS